MKYRVKYEKGNLSLMTLMFIICFLTCVFWYMLDEYVYFAIYLVVTILMSFIYYFTCYYIKDEYLLVRLGFIFIPIKYKNIKGIDNLNAGVKLKFNKVSMKIYPVDKDKFCDNLQKKVGGR